MDISGIQKIWGGLEGQIRVIYPAIDEVLLDNLIRPTAEEEHLSEAEDKAIRKSINLLMRNESYYFAGDMYAKDAILGVLYTLYGFDIIEQSPDQHFTDDIKDAKLVIATSLTVASSLPLITLVLCAVILTGWLTHLFRWGESVARISPETEPRVRGFIVQFFGFYISISYLFSLAYHAGAILGYEVRNGDGAPITSWVDCIYFSVITATTLGSCVSI